MTEASDFMDRVRSHRTLTPHSNEATRVAELLEKATGVNWSLNNPDKASGEDGLPVAVGNYGAGSAVYNQIEKMGDTVSIALATKPDAANPTVKLVAQKANVALLEARVASLTGENVGKQDFADRFGQRKDFGVE